MSSRMDRYNNSSNNIESTGSRREINKTLYRNLDDNRDYTEFTTDITNTLAVDIGSASRNSQTREGYHQLKEYDGLITKPKLKKELDDFNYLYNKEQENKVYDINNVLENARKNREDDNLENKRKLKNTNYNILASIDPNQIEEYNRLKEKKVVRAEDKELRSLIDTITSKTLAGELDKEATVGLLSELMATSKLAAEDINKDNEDEEIDEKLSLSKEILDKDVIAIKEQSKEVVPEKSIMNDADNEFYTRSMDLSDKDFDFDFDFKEKKVPMIIKILLLLILIGAVCLVAYFVYNMV